MDKDYNMVRGIDKLAELLIERGIEFCVEDGASLLFADAIGNPHECWMAGAEENLVNVTIVVTPEQAISVPDLNGVITENAKLRELVLEIWRSCPVSEDDCAKCQHHIEESDEDWCDILILMEELGVGVD